MNNRLSSLGNRKWHVILGLLNFLLLTVVHNAYAEPASDNWMTELKDDIKAKGLNEVIIPSAHDAGTSGIDENSPICEAEVSTLKELGLKFGAKVGSPALIAKLSKVQDLTMILPAFP